MNISSKSWNRGVAMPTDKNHIKIILLVETHYVTQDGLPHEVDFWFRL